MDYRKRFTELSRACRTPHPKFDNLNMPMSVKSDVIRFEGKDVTRKRIILTTVGCKMGTCVMCPFPAESDNAVTEQNLINQFDSSFVNDSIDNYEMITVFCNGNFFNEREIPAHVVDYIFSKVGKSAAKAITIESLPQFISHKKLIEAKNLLGDKKLQIFMGLQSADYFIRTTAVNTTCSKADFECVVINMLALQFFPAAFIIVKAPFLTEEEGVNDVLNTLRYLDGLGVYNSTLCPMRIAPNTFLDKIHRAGYYSPLHFMSIVKIFQEYAKFGRGAPMVNTTELKLEANQGSVCAVACDKCRDKTILALEKFLFSRDIGILNDISCDCYQGYIESNKIDQQLKTMNIEERVRRFVDEIEQR